MKNLFLPLLMLVLGVAPGYSAILAMRTAFFASDGLLPSDPLQRLLVISRPFVNTCPNPQCPVIFNPVLVPGSVGSVFTFDSTNANFPQVVTLLNNYSS